MSFKSDLVRLSSLRLLLGAGVGFLLFGTANLLYDTGLAVGLLGTGVTLIVISAVGHKRFGERVRDG